MAGPVSSASSGRILKLEGWTNERAAQTRGGQSERSITCQ